MSLGLTLGLSLGSNGGIQSLKRLTLPWNGYQIFEASPEGHVVGTVRDTVSGSTLEILSITDSTGTAAASTLFALSGKQLLCGSTPVVFADSSWYSVNVRETWMGLTRDSRLVVKVWALVTSVGTGFSDDFTGDGVLRSRTGWTGVQQTGSGNTDLIATASGMVSFVNASASSNIYNVTCATPSANHSAEFVLQGSPGAGNSPPSVLTLFKDSGTHIGISISAARTMQVYKRVSNTQTTFANVDPGASNTYVSGSTIRAEIRSGLIFIYQNGVLVNGAGFDVSDVPATNLKTGFSSYKPGAGTGVGISSIDVQPLSVLSIDTVLPPVFCPDPSSNLAYRPISGLVPSSPLPSTLEWRLRYVTGGATVTGYDWQTLDALIDTASGAPTFRAIVPTPSGGNYYIDVRDAANPSTVVTNVAFGAGDRPLADGQSNWVHNYDPTVSSDGTDTTGGRGWMVGIAYSTPISPANKGTVGFLNTLVAGTNRPAMLINKAVSATTVSQHMPGTAYFNAMISMVMDMGGRVNSYLIAQGHGDAEFYGSSFDVPGWAASWQTITNAVLEQCGLRDSEMPVFMEMSNGETRTVIQGTSAATGFLLMRRSQLLFSTLSPYYHLSHHALDIGCNVGDTVHISPDDHNTTWGPRFARSILRQRGLFSVDQMGPKWTTMSRSGAVVTFPMDLNGGTGWIVDAGTLGGYQFVAAPGYDGSQSALSYFNTPALTPPLAVSSVTMDGNNIVVTLASDPGGPVAFRYAASVSQTGSNPYVFDGAEMFGQAYTDTGGQAAAAQIHATYAVGPNIGLPPLPNGLVTA